jgi:hypothetical protein
MLGPGTVLHVCDVAGSGPHYCIVLSDPGRNPDRILLVSVTTYEDYKEDTCVLQPGEWANCPFIRHASCVDYRNAWESSLDRIESLIAEGAIRIFARLERQQYERVLDGARHSRFLANKYILLLCDQGLIEL